MREQEDNFEEATPEQLERIACAAEEIIGVCENECDHPSEALNALSSALVHVLCDGVVSKAAAIEAIQVFANSTLSMIEMAEEDNNVAWRQQRH